MGQCCATDRINSNNHKQTDLVALGGGVDEKTLAAIIKAQACFRGLMTRKMLKRKYGYEYKKPGMMNRTAVELDP